MILNENTVRSKSYKFSLRIIKLFIYLKEEKKEYDLSRQLLRSATSIGANIEEAEGGQSKKDFINKISISYKEARETHYWLRLLRDTDFIEQKIAESLINDCEELLKMLTAILNTSKSSVK